MQLTDRTILITGGASGIGLSIVKELLARDNQVITCGRNEAKLARAAAECPGLQTFVCDITDDARVDEMLAHIDAEYGGLDLVINNAAIFMAYNFADDPDALSRIEREITINLIGPLKLVHKTLPLLKKRKDSAVAMVSSGLAYVPLAATPVYSSTKAAIHHSCQTLRHQLKDTGIEVFELLPPFTETPMTDGIQSPTLKKISPELVAAEFIRGVEKGVPEIAVGQSKQLRLMRRLAPEFITAQLAKAL